MVLPERSRNNLLFLSLIFLVSCSGRPERITMSDENLIKKKGVYYFKDEPYSGILEEYDASKNLIGESELVDGKKNGVSKYYWPNRTLKFEANYKNGFYHGSVKRYFENGELLSWFNYDNGHESGKQQMWKSDGRIKVNYEVIDGRKYGLTGVKNCVNVLEEDGHTF